MEMRLVVGTLIMTGVCILIFIFFRLCRWHFRNNFRKDVTNLLQSTRSPVTDILTDSDLQHLPEVVRRYLYISGAVNRPKVYNFSVKLAGSLRQDEKSPWMTFTSRQYNGVADPTRLFFMEAVMKHLPVAGYHRYRRAMASMDIRLLSLIPVQQKSGTQMNVAETVTFFNDMCVMAPATLIDTRIKWISATANHVRASFTNEGIVITADLKFNAEGELTDFVSHDRYALQPDGSMKRMEWSTPLSRYRDFRGHRLASYAETLIALPGGAFCYGKFYVVDVCYNLTNENDWAGAVGLVTQDQ